MRAILIFHNCDGQSHKTVSTDHNSVVVVVVDRFYIVLFSALEQTALARDST